MKRKDCFFGLHFDFHACESLEIGECFNKEVLRQFIKKIKPDYIQCDSKGHPGYSSYPTEKGVCPSKIYTDILKEWREVTKEEGVLLYAHHSGVWDEVACKEHPEWAAVDYDGKVSDYSTSVFGEYVEKRLIPQIIEIADKYKLDGIWIDGDCWGAIPDFSEPAKKAWFKFTGKDFPKKSDENWNDYMDFCRKGFCNYVKKYVTEVKKICPKFEIASNWLNTSYAPVDENLTDFTSGDMATTDCVESARFESRVIADFNRPWDLMSWGFCQKTRNYKSAAQISQELACVLSVGGGVQVYFKQSHKNVIKNYDAVLKIMKDVSDFCLKRKSFCKDVKMIHCTGVLFSEKAFYLKKERLFADWEEGLSYTKGVRGLMDLILDNQYPSEIILTKSITKHNLSEYDLIAVPNFDDIENNVIDSLLDYVKVGGNLLLSGTNSLKFFAKRLNIEVAGEINGIMQIVNDDLVEQFTGTVLKLNSEQRQFMKYIPNSLIDEFEIIPSLYQLEFGVGKIYIIPFDIGLTYFYERSFVIKNFIKNILSKISIRLKGYGSSKVTLSIMGKDGKEYIHLVNMNGQSGPQDISCFDEITPIYDFNIIYQVGRRPAKIIKQPDNSSVEFEYKDNILTFVCDKLDIHTCFEIVYEDK